VHGGVSAAELASLGSAHTDVLDLSVNVNPWGPHPAVVHAVQQAALARYPDPQATAAREALARAAGVETARIVVGHGSTELLWAAISLLQGGARPWLIAGPTFSEPLIAARALGVAYVEHRSHERDDFRLDLAALSHALQECDAGGVYLCQPNNPTGAAVPATALRELCEQHPTRLFVLDQAFLALSTRHGDAALAFPDNVLCVRSLTKEHALPGLRVGYAIGAPSLLARLNARRPSWMVSTLAQAAVVAACEQTAYVADVRERLLHGAGELAAGCRALGLAVVPSVSHFFVVRVAQADTLRQRLLKRHGVVVRSCSSFGLPNHVRLAGCAEPERKRALAALSAECGP
jgi:histidinol-phosphate/aromatic aminotransferase/cobyric acid decarboxylase-like protein